MQADYRERDEHQVPCNLLLCLAFQVIRERRRLSATTTMVAEKRIRRNHPFLRIEL
jgi:hypothetical protein